MDSFTDGLYLRFALEIVIDGFIKATLLVGLAWGVTRLLHRASAAVRHGIWTLAVAGLLVLPVLSIALPAWNLHVPERLTAFFAPDPAASMSNVPQGTPASGSESETVDAASSTEAVSSTESKGVLLAEPHAENVDTRSERWATWLLLVWGSGAVFVLGRLLLHITRLRYITRQAEVPEAGLCGAVVEVLVHKLSIRRQVNVGYSSQASTPMTWGVWRPVVLLPEAARTWPAERLDVVLMHELAHVKRWDYASHLAAQTARALYWFNPLVWMASRRLYAEQERACDDLVLRAGTRPCDYAVHLLDLARTLVQQEPYQAGSIAMARHSTMKERMRAILNTNANRGALSWKAGLAATSLSACLLLPLAVVQPGNTARDSLAVQALALHLQADNFAGWQAAARASDLPRLAALLRHPDVTVRSRAAWALGERADPEAFAALLPALNDAEPQVRSRAIHALAKLDGSRALPYLTASLQDTCPYVRRSAVLALKATCRCHVLAAVPALLADEDVLVRTVATLAVGEALRSLRQEGDAEALAQMQQDVPPIVPALTARLQDASPTVRRHATFALGEARDEAALEGLEAALHDPLPMVRSEAVLALGKLGGVCAAHALQAALTDNDASVRKAAARALDNLDV